MGWKRVEHLPITTRIFVTPRLPDLAFAEKITVKHPHLWEHVIYGREKKLPYLFKSMVFSLTQKALFFIWSQKQGALWQWQLALDPEAHPHERHQSPPRIATLPRETCRLWRLGIPSRSTIGFKNRKSWGMIMWWCGWGCPHDLGNKKDATKNQAMVT